MNRIVFVLALGCSASAVWAVNADPQSNDCHKALAALEAREAELARTGAAPRTPTDVRWQALRRQAARACLGREAAASAPRPHSAQPPLAVPPVGMPPTPLPAPPAETPQRRAPPPLPGYKPPVSVMSCDALGCWTSDGARLPHTGRNPLDARVRCSVQGQIVMCL